MENNQVPLQNAQNALSEATKRAALAERKAADYLQAKDNAERQLHNRSTEAATLTTANQQLIAENQSLKDDFQKLGKHTKNCEKATANAQKEAKHAKGHAEHLIKSQNGQLKSAERRYADAARELKEWKDRYCFVEKPAKEKAGLQKRCSEWQSKAEKAQNEIAALREVLQGQQGTTEVEEDQHIKAEEDQSSIEAEEITHSIKTEEDQIGIKTEEPAHTISPEQIQSTAVTLATAQAATYKKERDTLHRTLLEEVAKNAKLAEWLVLRNAKLAESLGWSADGDGEA